MQRSYINLMDELSYIMKNRKELEGAVRQLRTELEERGETDLGSEEEMYEACVAESDLDDHWYNEEGGEEEEEEAIFNDDRYPTDIEINTVLFEEIIFKDLLSKRDRLIDTLQSVQEYSRKSMATVRKIGEGILEKTQDGRGLGKIIHT